MSDPVPFVSQTLKLSPKWKREAIRELENFLGPAVTGLRKINDKPWGWELDVTFKDSELAAQFAAALASKEIGL